MIISCAIMYSCITRGCYHDIMSSNNSVKGLLYGYSTRQDSRFCIFLHLCECERQNLVIQNLVIQKYPIQSKIFHFLKLNNLIKLLRLCPE